MKKRVCTSYHRMLMIVGMSIFTAFHVVGQVTGTVFRDYNGDGVKQGTEPLVAGVVVNAYLANSAVPCGTTTTSGAAAPNYTLTGCGSSAVRVEFVIPSSGACSLDSDFDFTSTGGNSYGSSVQFATGTSSNVNFAINTPADYTGNVSANVPSVYVTCFVNGDPLTTSAGTGDALVGIPYTASGTTPAATHIATAAKIGSAWGLAYSPQAKRIFTSAVLRRHVGLGPQGSGAIYMIDPSGVDLVTNLINLDALLFPTRGSGAYAPSVAGNVVTFTDVIGTNAERGIMGISQPSRDAAAFDQVGKVGLGDIDLSADGRYLYVTNLYDRKLYEIDLQNAASPVAPSPANVRFWDIPNPGCTGGTYRPWAVRYYRGKVYVGLVCDAQNSQVAANMSASIYEFDPSGAGSFAGSALLSFPLNYPKGIASDFITSAPTGWFPWTGDFGAFNPETPYKAHPQPIFSDIEIDDDGSFVLGFADRGAMQLGWFNYGPNSGDNTLYAGMMGGDILRAYKNPATCNWTLESNATAGPYTTGGIGNNEGPGGGEFYYGDETGGFGHHELSQGGLGILRGSGETAVSIYDPEQFDSFGVGWYDNENGQENRGYELFYTGNSGGTPGSGTFSKAASLGDLELGVPESPLEIGNRVWEDTNDDGVQDASEPGISGVAVQLWKETTPGNYTQVATVTTNANGNYYFSNATGTSVLGITYDPDLLPNMNYQLRFPLTNSTLTLSAKANMGGADPNADVRDTDASLAGVISFSTGNAGQNNHTYDVAYVLIPTDYGDLPDTGAGTGSGNYETQIANGGPNHVIVSGIKIGAIAPDAEIDGQQNAGADGDDNTSAPDDEDGWPAGTMLVAGQPANVTIDVMNMTGIDAKLVVFIDFDGDGDFGGVNTTTDEMFSATVANNATSVPLSIAVPVNAVLNANIGLRIRLSSDPAFIANMLPTGAATDGEVEDYLVQVMGFDYGDLADSGAGTGAGNYETQSANGGPSHKIVTGLKIGAAVDAETNGQQSTLANGDGADEDGFNPVLPANMLVAGQTTNITVPVMNMTGGDAKLTVYIDFDNDGDLTDAGEMFSVTVPNNATSAMLSVVVPVGAVLNTDLGARFRLTTDVAMSPNGPASNGEVEDYLVQVMGFDYGDLADSGAGVGAGNYETQSANGGASHKIVTDNTGAVILKIGATVDNEGNGQQSALADGDGADEDGFNPALPANMLVAGQTTNITVPVMNMTGGDAKLTVYIDFDNDGDLTDANEMFSTTVANNATSAMLSVVVPANVVLNTNLGTRFRLTTDVAMSPNGPASNGEVEDYLVQVMGFDYGDLPDSGAGTGAGNYETAAANGGPSHKIVTNPAGMVTLKIGATVDAESDGQPNVNAQGDDAVSAPAIDDEDGITWPMFVTGTASNVTVNLMNMTGGDAKLTLFFDWDRNGNFTGPNEMYSTTVANNATSATIAVTPPLSAALNLGIAIRVRLSTDMAASMSPTGPAPDGEVEDYMVSSMGFDYGDLSDGGAGTSTAPMGTPANYNTLLSDNGPRHKIVTDASGNVTLKIGTSVDDDVNGQPSADAGETTGGDDNTETPDDEELDAYLNSQLFILTQTTNLSIPVMNMTGGDAKLTVFFDFNKDGDFLDAGEMFSTTVANNATTANIAVVVPANAVVGDDLGFRIRLAGDPAESMSPVGEAQSGEVEDYMVQVIGFDYGDHPITYGTTDPDGPRHIVSENLKLGASVDAELNGIPSAMSGSMPGTGGDDNDAGLATFGTSTPAGDDEDGVVLSTPMIPGAQACFVVNAMNMTGSSAVLQAWVDWDGNGSFGVGEQLNTGSFAPSGATVPAGGLTNAQLCFSVPSNAVFASGNAFVRFRLSPLGGLSANSQTAPVPFGEIEDYKFTLAKVGNYVWEDVDGNGQQNEAGSTGLNGVTVQLLYYGLDGVAGGTGANADVPYTTVTAVNGGTNGYYYFCGLIPGNYTMSIPTLPTNFVSTAPNVGSDVTDSENPAGTAFTITDPAGQPTGENGPGDAPNVVGGFPDNQNNQTIDFGLLVLAELGNYTWVDLNENGLQDGGDLPLGGVTVMLMGTDNLGNPVTLTTTTAADGSYLFDDLWPGTYAVMFNFSTVTTPSQLAGFGQYLQFTLSNQGTNDAIDSDANPNTGKTGNYNLVSQSSEMTVDAGAIVPCLPPTNLTASMIMLNTATLSWQVNNDPFTGINVTNHCWRVTIGGQGYNGNPGQAIQEMTVCAGDPGVTIAGNIVSINVAGLAPGTCYQFTVSETCDGIGPDYNASAVTISAPFCTFDTPPVVTATATAPSCPVGTPGFVANGTITVTVAHGTSCQTGIYNIEVVSGPYLPLAPLTYAGVNAGNYTFTGAGPGSYVLRVSEVSGTCNQKPSLHPVLVTVVVPNAVDITPPTKYVEDVLGNPVTALGPYTLPEGVCSRQVQLYVSGDDTCDGPITAGNAVTATAVMNPATVQPGTQVNVTHNGNGVYLVDIDFAVGTTTLTISIRDASGNVTSMTYTVVVIDNTDPVLTITGGSQYVIPVCETTTTGNVSVQIDDLCDEAINWNNLVFSVSNGATFVTGATTGNVRDYVLTFPGAGTYVATATYTDASGNTGTVSQTFTVTQVATNTPPVIYANAETVRLAACEQQACIVYSFIIEDDCEPINPAQVIFNGGGSGLPNLNGTGFFYTEVVGPNTMYFEVSGCVAPGVYFPLITYQGITANPTITALPSLAQNQPADIVLPAINVTIPQCDHIEVVVPITITDDCDNPINPARAVFTLCGAPIVPSEVNAAAGYFEFILPLTAAQSGCLLEVTYTDAAGAVRTVNTLITVTAQPDTWSPVVVYPSQPIAVELNECNNGQQEVCFEVTATDNCNGDLIPVVTINGQLLTRQAGTNRYCYVVTAAGNYNVLITATDASGNTTVEDFVITATETVIPPVNLACQGMVNMTLEDGCQRTLSASNVLIGTFGCLTDADFEVVVVDGNPSNGAVIDGCGEFIYEIRLRAGVNGGGFTTCWGMVRSEDKTKPTIVCPANTSQATVNHDVQSFTGALASTDPTLNLLNHSCYTDFFNPAAGLHYYDVQTFTVTANDVYTFEVSSTWGDASMSLYQGAFDAGNPCQNMIAHTEDQPLTSGFFAGFDPAYRIALPLRAGQTYTLMTTSWGALTTGNYTWSVISDGNGLIDINPAQTGAQPAAVSTPITFDLICDDINRIFLSSPAVYYTDRLGNPLPANQQPAGFNELWTRLGYTGRPVVSDNCGQLKVTVSDVLANNGNCGPQVITRTFRVEDKQNSPCPGTPNFASCTQTITVRKATQNDANFIPLVTTLECDESFPTLSNGNPSPAVTGYPFIQTAFGIYDINQTYCNLAAQYIDDPRIEVCAGSYKLVRNWTVLDWCNPGALLQFPQLIKVGDFTGPTVTCPTVLDPWGVAQTPITYSTTPYDCTASFVIPDPVVTDACSQSWTISIQILTDVTVPVLNQYGQQVGATTQSIVVKTVGIAESRFVTGIPVGNHRFRYTVTDACGNVSTIECPFRVLDLIEPNAVCDDQLNISIGGQGFTRVHVSDINEGSNDNCGLVTMEVRRAVECASTTGSFTPWGEYVDFTCCDAIGVDGGRVRIELRVTDGSGNQNTCWLDVLVQDKIRPFCYAPHNTSINCDELPYDFNPRDTAQLAQLFNGANPPSATDNCTAYVRELVPTVNLHDCGWGTIVRNFQAVDQAGNTSTNACRQTITINENHNYWIKFPRDYSANCGDPAPTGIEYEEIGCDLLAVSTVDEPFSASGDECYKIFRTFRVINWCEYNGQDAPVIVGRDEDCDNVPGYAVKNLATGQLVTSPRFPNNGIYVIVRGTTGAAKTSWYDSNTNPADNMPAAFQKGTSCDGLTNPAGHWVNSNQKPAIRSNGFWQYTQHIIVYDNVDPTITVAPFDPFCSYDSPTAADPICEGPVEIDFSVNELCTPDDVTIKVFLDAFRDGTFPFDYNVRRNPDGSLSGNTGVFTITGSYPNYTITAGALPIGLHRVEIHAEDGCGNARSVMVNFEVRDCKAPTPICYNGLTVTLMPIDTNNDGTPDEGMAAVWASDFIASPIVDCSMPIRYSIRRAGQTPDINRTGVNFSCADYNAADGTAGTSHVIYIDAWDGAGNRDFCETYVLVQDQTGICTGPALGSIAGTIRTETQQTVEGVDVALSGPMTANATTPEAGTYSFGNLEENQDYTITPVLDVNYLNGVSTFDLVLISRHILGVQLLDSPYKMIAADVNNSRSITTLDLIQLRRLILAIDTEFANNTSWRFVPASYSFPVPTNPWFEQFPEVININDLTGNEINQNFFAVKIGDVNGSVVPNLAAVEDRNVQGTFGFDLEDRAVKAGEEVKVAFRGKDMERIMGYQLTLGFDRTALSLDNIEYGVAKEGNFGLRHVNEGEITMSWHEMNADNRVKSDEVLFTLVFRATASGKLSDLLSVSSRLTRAEAYDRNSRTLDVSLNFGSRELTEEYALYQNQPNPFAGKTMIGFYLPNAGETTLTITDVRGRVLKVFKGEYGRGMHQIQLDGEDLPAGVLQYTLISGDFTATRKMVLTR
ncbi:MAG TPA: GEVED domain-containing protein [Saprospiraceae bacterium]|nr:GEVED domain-containing protein [Saprospiraceae bacterium]